MNHRNLARACAAALLLAAGSACKSSTDVEIKGLPNSIVSCETNTATLCATWTKTKPGIYHAQWEQGSVATIRAVQFSSSGVVFVRDDPSGTSAGMHAVYTGVPSGSTIPNGTVTWTYGGQTFSGFWQAEW
jgi:hypothetical protein